MDAVDPLPLALHRAGYRLTEPRIAVDPPDRGPDGPLLGRGPRPRGPGPPPRDRPRDDLPDAGRPVRARARSSGSTCRAASTPTSAARRPITTTSSARAAAARRRSRTPGCARWSARSRAGPGSASTSTASSCSACARPARPRRPADDARGARSSRSAPSSRPSPAAGWRIRAVRYVGIVIAVGAGIRIGAAFFDLIPEAIAYLGSVDAAMLWTAIGFLAFYAIEKLTTLHVGHETAAELDHDDGDAHARRHGRRGRHGHPQLPRRRRARGRPGGRRRDRDRHRGRRHRPPLQRRDRRRELPAGEPDAVVDAPTAG